MPEFSVAKSAQELLADQMWKMLSEIGVDPTFKDSEGFEMDADGVLLEIARIMIERLPAEEPEWEYGWKSHFPNGEEYEWLACESREHAEQQIRSNQDVERMSGYEDDERLTYSLWKRTTAKAGPWVPVKQEEGE